MRELRSRTGAIAAPNVAWLLLRGLATLEVRVARQTESARMIAERLRGHPLVETVRYPGFGALLSFDVADADAARRVETATHLIANMTSLGGVTSRIEARSRWEGERVPPRAPPPVGRSRERRRALGRPRASAGRSLTMGGFFDRLLRGKRPTSTAEIDRIVVRQLVAREWRRSHAAAPRDALHLLRAGEQRQRCGEGHRRGGLRRAGRAAERGHRGVDVRAEAHRIVGFETVQGFRAWFEQIAAEHDGEYDGWEPAVKP